MNIVTPIPTTIVFTTANVNTEVQNIQLAQTEERAVPPQPQREEPTSEGDSLDISTEAVALSRRVEASPEALSSVDNQAGHPPAPPNEEVEPQFSVDVRV